MRRPAWGGDAVDYSASAGVTVTLSGGAAIVNTGGVGTDTLSGIENIIGGSGIDTLNGDAFGNYLAGGGNNDALSGFSGNDRLDGGIGDDDLQGGDDDDVLIGGSGVDTLAGGTGADVFIYNSRSDVGTFAGGEDQMLGFSLGQGDKIAFDFDNANPTLPTSGFFNGVALPADFLDGNHVQEQLLPHQQCLGDRNV